MVAHGVHLGLVAAGLAGLGALLAPTLAPALAHALAPTRAHHWRGSAPVRDPHDHRVRALRAAVGAYAAGAPVTVLAGTTGTTGTPGAVCRPTAREERSPLLMPLAVTSTVGAAGIHAAMAPPHLREGLILGAFFLVCAGAQLAWAERALRRPSARLLVLGAVGHLAVLALWATTRTVGLPLGLLPVPEAVGAWDLTAVAFEAVAVGACLAARRSPARRTAGWAEWHPAAHAWLALGVALLVALSLGGL